HHLVLARIDAKAEIIGEGGIQEAETVGKVDLLEEVELRSLAQRDGRRRPFADPVHAQEQGLVERRGIEGAGEMRLVMLGEQELVRVEGRIEPLQLGLQQALLK